MGVRVFPFLQANPLFVPGRFDRLLDPAVVNLGRVEAGERGRVWQGLLALDLNERGERPVVREAHHVAREKRVQALLHTCPDLLGLHGVAQGIARGVFSPLGFTFMIT